MPTSLLIKLDHTKNASEEGVGKEASLLNLDFKVRYDRTQHTR